MVFEDRLDAARRLAQALKEYRGLHPLVLGIPRGAVPMARVIAEAVGGDLDVVLVRKIPAPGNPELAIGSIAESGDVYLTPSAKRFADDEYVRAESERQLDLIRRRRKAYTPHGEAADPRDRLVIIVDDGLATGSTMMAALRLTRKRNPRLLVAAAAVAPPETVALIRGEADRVVCLETPADFAAVGEFFRDFDPVGDEEVATILRGWASRVAPRTEGSSL